MSCMRKIAAEKDQHSQVFLLLLKSFVVQKLFEIWQQALIDLVVFDPVLDKFFQ